MSRQHPEWRWLGVLAMALIACAPDALPAAAPATAGVLVEAESFAELGGWVVDAQFMDVMGSPYLLAHGLGKPVADARTTVILPAAGTYRLWARTRNWTAPHPSPAGQFEISLDGNLLPIRFGAAGQGWVWQDGGLVTATNPAIEVRLADRTGFDGRCDALYFAPEDAPAPPADGSALLEWRRALLGRPAAPEDGGEYDLVVTGGGIAGCGAAIAAARLGMRVALIHDRPVLGGNASQEIRVHTMGDARGAVVSEINTAHYPNGSDQSIAYDQRRHRVAAAETNIDLHLEWRAFGVVTQEARVVAVDACHIRTGQERRFRAPWHVDATGDAWIGYWAGARHRMGREPRAEFNEPLAPSAADAMTLGTSLLWSSKDAGQPASFPDVPWAMDVARDYAATSGEWQWEYGMNHDTILDAEEIRDHLLRAIYGSFANAKRLAANARLELDWVGYVAGKRESRRLEGDYILTEHDVRNRPHFSDAVAMGTWGIDLHYPSSTRYDFLSRSDTVAVQPYWIPYRCLYSTNVDNLFMAGRCLSATHVALGSTRVMNTCGQMGVAAGTAAHLCKKHQTTPRGVYRDHLAELRSLLGLSAGTEDLANLVTVVDNRDAVRARLTGAWAASTYEPGFFGEDYLHDGNADKGSKSVQFIPDLPVAGEYQVYLRWTSSASRSEAVPVDLIGRAGTQTVTVNQRLNGGRWMLAGSIAANIGTGSSVRIRTAGTTGHVIVDAAAFCLARTLDSTFQGEPWQDDDQDGLCNYVEFTLGTNPRDPGSFLKLDWSMDEQAPRLRFLAPAWRACRLQYRDAFGAGSWQDSRIFPPTASTRECVIEDLAPGLGSSRFYRIASP
ncbi:MAG TPA: FAD-dependent oxidoreductase [Candidatus Paceibacterota bacterium]|nr:FAD-dependent oxidoreductase [Verrucomicrobiota bacterium]HRZ43651.1 FAD-dependent oxidoreductase [Candidatus Paceibacterota bacterium]HRZ91284.1 FAD-dependent oxidoreductase [Candidatus Paceibacterota bacterium]